MHILSLAVLFGNKSLWYTFKIKSVSEHFYFFRYRIWSLFFQTSTLYFYYFFWLNHMIIVD